MLTAAVESLHQTYPGSYLTDVRTSCDALFAGNPNITSLKDDEGEMFDMHYSDLIHQSNPVPNTFLRGFCYDLGKKLGVPLELTTNRPQLYLTPTELIQPPCTHPDFRQGEKYWVVTAGVKRDFTLKQWPLEYFQEVMHHFAGKIQFVQVGSDEHDHPFLDGVINLVGRTSIRELMRLVYTCAGGLGPITLLQHLCAAFERPYVALLGGREPVAWTQYPLQTTLHTLGRLPCCRTSACWRSRVVPLHDGSEQDRSLCDLPVVNMKRSVGKCMEMIKPSDVISAMEGYLGVDSSLRRSAPDIGSTFSRGAARLPLAIYSSWGTQAPIVPAPIVREWMKPELPDLGQAWHSIVLANQSGWFVLADISVAANWNGGSAPSDIQIQADGIAHFSRVSSCMGSGILTWTIPYVIRTPPGWNLLFRGPANCVKDGLIALEGLVEMDWIFDSLVFHWKFTRAGRCDFQRGEPVGMVVPQRRFDLEHFTPHFATDEENRRFRQQLRAWRGRHQEDARDQRMAALNRLGHAGPLTSIPQSNHDLTRRLSPVSDPSHAPR